MMELERLLQENARLRAEVGALRPHAELSHGLTDAVVLTDAEMRITYWNDGAWRLHGYTRDEALGRPVLDLLSGIGTDGVRRALLAAGQWAGECRARGKDGQLLEVRLTLNVLRDSAGTVTGFGGVGRDVTHEQAARRREERESQRSRQLALVAHEMTVEPESVSRVLDIFTRGVADLLDDVVVLLVMEPGDEGLRAVSLYDRDPTRLALIRDAVERSVIRPGEGVSGRALLGGEAVMHHTMDPHGLACFLPPAFRELEAAHAVYSILSVPVQARGRRLGALTCVRTRPGEPHDEVDCRFVHSVAGHAALAILNARLLAAQCEHEEELQGRTRDLEMAVGELEAFAYSVSHDVRAPLRTIEGLAQLMLDEGKAALTEEQCGWLERLQHAAKHLAELVDALLVLSRVTRWKLAPVQVDLTALARRTMATLTSRDPARVLRVEIAESMAVLADPTLLEVVLSNLLENAWKFTARVPEASVQVGVVPGQEAPIFFVRDNGAGFDPASARRLFEPFERLHRAADFPGTGIGLATVQRVVRRHGGRVWAESATGKGATFFFTLASEPGHYTPAQGPPASLPP